MDENRPAYFFTPAPTLIVGSRRNVEIQPACAGAPHPQKSPPETQTRAGQCARAGVSADDCLDDNRLLSPARRIRKVLARSLQKGSQMRPLPEYQHRACKCCGKRIPRWTNGKLTPSSRLFCSSGCGRFSRRMDTLSGRARKREIESIKPAFREAAIAPRERIEGRPEYGPCQACGRLHNLASPNRPFCSARCEAYIPLPPRKPDGEWFIVAGPVDYCSACAMAIGPRKPHGYITPYRNVDGLLFCSRECRTQRKAKSATDIISPNMPVSTDITEMPISIPASTGRTAGCRS